MSNDREKELQKALRSNLRKRKTSPVSSNESKDSQMRQRVQSINKKTGPKLKRPSPDPAS